MGAIQLDLFEEWDELGLMKKELEQMQDSLDRQRKAQFAKIHQISKELIELKEEMHKLRFRLP